MSISESKNIYNKEIDYHNNFIIINSQRQKSLNNKIDEFKYRIIQSETKDNFEQHEILEIESCLISIRNLRKDVIEHKIKKAAYECAIQKLNDPKSYLDESYSIHEHEEDDD